MRFFIEKLWLWYKSKVFRRQVLRELSDWIDYEYEDEIDTERIVNEQKKIR